MEHDPFDDVEVRFLDDPDAPQEPPRRRRRWVAGAVVAAIVAGGFAAAASAGGGSSNEAAAPAAPKQEQLDMRWPDSGLPHMRGGKPCDRDGKRESLADRDESRFRY